MAMFVKHSGQRPTARRCCALLPRPSPRWLNLFFTPLAQFSKGNVIAVWNKEAGHARNRPALADESRCVPSHVPEINSVCSSNSLA